MTAVEKEVWNIAKQFMESVLLYGDTQKAMETVSKNVMGVGIGDQGTISNADELRRLLQQMNANAPVPCQINYPKINIKYHPPSFATGNIVYEIISDNDGLISTSSFIQTISAVKENGNWKLCLLQAVPLNLAKDSIKNYPLVIDKGVFSDLKDDMQRDTLDLINKNFSGGVWGTYMTDIYPLYFANEILIKRLGYTHDEFYELYKDSAIDIIYKDDKERILTQVSTYIKEKADDYTLKFRMKTKGGGFVWMIERARVTTDSNGVPVLLAVVTDISEIMSLQARLEKKNETILSSIQYASKIQRELLPSEWRFKSTFSDHSIIWSPRDIVGGDMYWLKTFSEGSVLAVCDCTGHGTPGALLTMLVVSAFDTLVNDENYQDTADLMLKLDRRIATVLNVHTVNEDKDLSLAHIHDGCDAAIMFIANDGTITLSSSGIHVFISDGKDVKNIKGQRLQIGDGKLADKIDIKMTTIPHNNGDSFYVASDGLFDQIGGEDDNPFGYQTFKKIILENHNEKQAVISEKIWDAFEAYRGDNSRRDDVELITFKP